MIMKARRKQCIREREKKFREREGERIVERVRACRKLAEFHGPIITLMCASLLIPNVAYSA